MNLKEKSLVITGASRGLGKAVAVLLAGKEARVMGTARSSDEIPQLEKETGAIFTPCDVTRPEQVESVARSAIEKFGKIDVWINNAGVWLPHPLVPVANVTAEDTRAMLDVNLFGLMYGSKTAIAAMRAQKSGTIVNILSTSALEGRSGSAGYCASKFAADGFSKAMRAELIENQESISIINVYPGGMKTGLFNGKEPLDLNTFMTPEYVAEKIVLHLEGSSPAPDLVIRRPR